MADNKNQIKQKLNKLKGFKDLVKIEKINSFLRESQNKNRKTLSEFKDYLKGIKIEYKSIPNSVIKKITLNVEQAQEWFENSLRNEHNEIVLSQPKFWMNAITWSLMAGTGLGISWLAIAKTEEIVIATGKLEPIIGVAEIQMPIQGIAEEILVKEGEIVSKGQILIKLDTEISESKIAALQESIKLNESIVSKLRILSEEGAVSELQYLEQKNKGTQLKSQLQESQTIMKYQFIKAPIKGKVFDLTPWGPGFVAQQSQPVLKIVPIDNLLAKIEIDSRKIGFVSVGKKADISIDSFPASDFGVIEGEVISISSDALSPSPSLNKGYRYPAKIKLNSQVLEQKGRKSLPLQPGMSLTANIKLRKVSYLQLLLGTFRTKAESLQEI